MNKPVEGAMIALNKLRSWLSKTTTLREVTQFGLYFANASIAPNMDTATSVAVIPIPPKLKHLFCKCKFMLKM